MFEDIAITYTTSVTKWQHTIRKFVHIIQIHCSYKFNIHFSITHYLLLFPTRAIFIKLHHQIYYQVYSSMCATPTGKKNWLFFFGTRIPALKMVYNPLTDIKGYRLTFLQGMLSWLVCPIFVHSPAVEPEREGPLQGRGFYHH